MKIPESALYELKFFFNIKEEDLLGKIPENCPDCDGTLIYWGYDDKEVVFNCKQCAEFTPVSFKKRIKFFNKKRIKNLSKTTLKLI